MRCSICDRALAPDEIKLDPRSDTFDPCGTCMSIIDEVFSHDSEEEISEQIIDEWGEENDPEFSP